MLSGFHFLSAGGIARQVSSHDFLKVALETAGENRTAGPLIGGRPTMP